MGIRGGEPANVRRVNIGVILNPDPNPVLTLTPNPFPWPLTIAPTLTLTLHPSSSPFFLILTSPLIR